MAIATSIVLIKDISACLFSTAESDFKEATAKIENGVLLSAVGVTLIWNQNLQD